MHLWASVFLLLLLAQNSSWGATADSIPLFKDVAEHALNYARLEPLTIRNWEKNVRKAPWLPKLQFGFQRRLKNVTNLHIEDSVAVNSSGITVGPTQEKQIEGSDDGVNFEVKALWHLDEILFSKKDLQISQQASRLAQERERILNQVRQSYFKLKKGLSELSQLKKTGASSFDLEQKKLEISEATWTLDSFTGGWFYSQVGEMP